MSDGSMPGNSSPFPGSFAETISGAQGGPTFGIMGGDGSDMLPTHPKASKASKARPIKWSIKYRQFDLSAPDEVAELEQELTDIANDPLRQLRQERLANDREGFTIVTVSWAVGEVQEPEKKEPERVDEEGKPYALQQQYPFPTIEDGESPGTGGTLPPPGVSPETQTEEDSDA